MMKIYDHPDLILFFKKNCLNDIKLIESLNDSLKILFF